MSLGNRIMESEEGKKIIDLGRGRIYLGEGKVEVSLTKGELRDLCHSFLLMANSKELRYKTEPLFNLLSELEEDLKWGSDGIGELRLEKGRLLLRYGSNEYDVTEIANKEGFSIWHYIHALGLERTGLAGGESLYEWKEPEKTSLRKKLGALGIIGLIAGAASAGIYCGIKNWIKNGYDKDYITLKEIAEENNPELIKKYIWPLYTKPFNDKYLLELSKVSQSGKKGSFSVECKKDDKYVEIRVASSLLEPCSENFIKQLETLRIPYRPVPCKEYYDKFNVSYPVQQYSEDAYSVLIPTEKFLENKKKLIKLISQSSGTDKKIVTENVNKLISAIEYRRTISSVTPVIKDWKEIDIENASSPHGDALKFQKILQEIEHEEYRYDEEKAAEFDKFVKSKLEAEGYTIEKLSNMNMKKVLEILAKLVEDNLEWDNSTFYLINPEGMKIPKLNYSYKALKTGKGCCADYSFAYEEVIKILKDDIPKLRNVIITSNPAPGHIWNNIMYFDGNRLVISPIDLSYDDGDGIPLGSRDNDTLTDFSAVDKYHYFTREIERHPASNR